jgi:hypothetical protein
MSKGNLTADIEKHWVFAYSQPQLHWRIYPTEIIMAMNQDIKIKTFI